MTKDKQKTVHYDKTLIQDKQSVDLNKWNVYSRMDWFELKKLVYILDGTVVTFLTAITEIQKKAKSNLSRKDIVDSINKIIDTALKTKENLYKTIFEEDLPLGLEGKVLNEMENNRRELREVRKSIAEITQNDRNYSMNHDNYRLTFVDNTLADNTKDKLEHNMHESLPTYKELNQQLNKMSILKTVTNDEQYTPELNTVTREIDNRRQSTGVKADLNDTIIVQNPILDRINNQSFQTPVPPDCLRTNNFNWTNPRPIYDNTTPKKLEPNINKFKGNHNEDVEDWLFQINQAFVRAQIPEHQKLSHALLFVENLPFTILREFIQAKRAWVEFEAELRRMYLRTDATDKYRAELANLTHRNGMSIDAYNTQFLKCSFNLKMMDDGDKFFHYVKGLKEKTKTEIKCRDIKTLDEAIALATRLEQEIETRNINYSSTKKYQNYINKEFKPNNNSFKNNWTLRKKYKNSTPIKKPDQLNKSKKDITCHRCKKKGHYERIFTTTGAKHAKNFLIFLN